MDPFDLMLTLEERGRPDKCGRVHAHVDRMPRTDSGAIFGGRCRGVCPMCRPPLRSTISARRSARENQMTQSKITRSLPLAFAVAALGVGAAAVADNPAGA